MSNDPVPFPYQTAMDREIRRAVEEVVTELRALGHSDEVIRKLVLEMGHKAIDEGFAEAVAEATARPLPEGTIARYPEK